MNTIREQFLAGIISKGTYITESSKAPSPLLAEAILMEGALWSKVTSGVARTFRAIKSFFTPERNMSIAVVLFILVILLKTVKNPDEVEIAAQKAMEKVSKPTGITPADIKYIHQEMLRSARFGTAGDYTGAATRKAIGPVLKNAIVQELGINKKTIEDIVKASGSSTAAFQSMMALIAKVRVEHPDINDAKMDHIISMILNTSEVAQYNMGLSANFDNDKEPLSYIKDFTL